MKIKNFLVILVLIAITGIAYAEEEKNFSGSGETGLLITTGNSETDSVNAKLGLKYEKDHFLGEINLAALYSSKQTETTDENNVTTKEDKVSAEKYNYAAKLGYRFNPANYLFLNADYEDDRFSGYDYKTTYALGYGRKLIATDTTQLDIEVGPAYRYDKTNGYYTDNDEFIDEQTEDELVFRGYGNLSYKFSDAVSFQQEVTVVTGSSNTNTKSVTALKSQIVGALSMKASYKVNHNTDVPEDNEKTDTETALTLVYDF